MKTERVTILASPDFKAYLAAEATREGISVGELVRMRCERKPSEEEVILTGLTAELNESISEAKRSLKSGLDEAQEVLAELRAKRGMAEPAIPKPTRRSAKGARR